MILVNIRDLKAETWHLPHAVHNRAVALRDFERLVNDPSHTLLSDSPSDFDLYEVGTYDERTGLIVGYSSAEFVKIVNGFECKNSNSVPSIYG